MVASIPMASAANAATAFDFSTNAPDGLMAMATRPASTGSMETETADDFVLSKQTSITSATFTGLVPAGASLNSIHRVVVEIYRVFPKDSQDPPSPVVVPTRVNSPSDVAFASRDSAPTDGSAASLSFTKTVLNANFTAAKSIDMNVKRKPPYAPEGPVTGQEVQFNVTFSTAFDLPADHYFFVPQVYLFSTARHFFWLSAPKPIVAPGTPFSPDLQTWIRNSNLDPNWLRVGTDIVGNGDPNAPTFNAAFSLHGSTK